MQAVILRIMTPNTNIRHLTEQELKCLERFAIFEISLDQLRSCLRSVMEFDFEGHTDADRRSMQLNFIAPDPGVLITKWHIENALTKKRNGEITDSQLIEWATMLLMNHGYQLDESEDALVAEWLNDISFDLRPFDE